MSSRFPSEQLSDLRREAPRFEPALLQAERPPAVLAVEDVNVASRSPARLLITASTQQTVEAVARRIHDSGPRAQFPFVMTSAGEFPVGAQAMREECVSFLDAAAGGSVLVRAVEEMPAAVQEALIELLAGLESVRRPSAAVRLIAGTTVSLLDRIAAGTFSEQLFYRLNVIHLMVADGFPATSPVLNTLSTSTSTTC
jgi:DNA-binding NtrC family response regulator